MRERDRPGRGGFWSYLRSREIDHVPSRGLRWWLLGLIVLGWAVEQYEGLKIGPVLVYVLAEFDKTLKDWGHVAASFYALAALAMAGSFMMAGISPAVHAASRDQAPRMGRAMVYAWVSLAFTIPARCALYSETAESISPHGVGRAFGITATLSPLAGLTLNLGLPRVVDLWGWSTWMMFAGVCCLCVAALVSFGEGPWWVRKADRSNYQVTAA